MRTCKKCGRETLHDEYCSSFCHFLSNNLEHPKSCGTKSDKKIKREVNTDAKECLYCKTPLKNSRHKYCSQSCVQKNVWAKRRLREAADG